MKTRGSKNWGQWNSANEARSDFSIATSGLKELLGPGGDVILDPLKRHYSKKFGWDRR